MDASKSLLSFKKKKAIKSTENSPTLKLPNMPIIEFRKSGRIPKLRLEKQLGIFNTLLQVFGFNPNILQELAVQVLQIGL